MPSGFLCIDKPLGKTSRDVTTYVHKLFKPEKVGHIGTLDPLATGLLVIAVGSATRLTNRMHEFPKAYVGRFRLGFRSDTEDITGQVEQVDLGTSISADQLADAAQQFVGSIEQVPPAFSAAKVNGRRAYDLARAGRAVELEPKSVEVHELDVIDATLNGDHAEFSLRIVCGSGTYIRSLGRDIAAAVGTSAVMTQLERTHVGPFDMSFAIPLNEVTADSTLIDGQIAVEDLDKIELTAAEAKAVSHGNAINVPHDTSISQYALLTPGGRLIAIAEPSHLGLQPRVVVPVELN